MQCPLFSSRNLTVFFYLSKFGKIGYLIPQLSSKFHLENLHFCSSRRWICQPKELQPKLKWNYATKWTTLWRWDPPNTFVVVCFLNQIQFTNCTIDLNHVLYESPVDSCLNRVSVQHQYILSVDDFWSVKKNQCLMQILHFGPLTLHSLDWNYDNDVTSLCSSPQCIFIYWIQILLGHI